MILTWDPPDEPSNLSKIASQGPDPKLGAAELTAVVAGTTVRRAESAAVHDTRRFQFVQVDVFASQRLQGNPLAVFTDARGLSDLEMQAIARETNLEGTTFVLPRAGSAARCTAAWMVRYGLANSDQTVHIEQGVEINRPSRIFVRAGREGEKVLNVRVGGNAVEVAEGEYSL